MYYLYPLLLFLYVTTYFLKANMTTINLEQHGIEVSNILRNPSPGKCYEQALSLEAGSAISSKGALIAISGHKTGRSPSDKRVVGHEDVYDDIWWGDVNIDVDDRS